LLSLGYLCLSTLRLPFCDRDSPPFKRRPQGGGKGASKTKRGPIVWGPVASQGCRFRLVAAGGRIVLGFGIAVARPLERAAAVGRREHERSAADVAVHRRVVEERRRNDAVLHLYGLDVLAGDLGRVGHAGLFVI